VVMFGNAPTETSFAGDYQRLSRAFSALLAQSDNHLDRERDSAQNIGRRSRADMTNDNLWDSSAAQRAGRCNPERRHEHV